MNPVSQIYKWNNLLNEAENGNDVLQNEVALNYENGIEYKGIEILARDMIQAFRWTKISYENGNKEALVRYADYLSSGENCEKNTELAIKIYEEGVKLGISRAAFNLGVEYKNMQDYNNAFKHYKIAGELTNGYGEFTVAICYYYGIGTEINLIKASELLKKVKFPESFQYEVDEANYILGMLYLKGEVVEKSIERARYYLELADFDKDHRSAQELLLIIGRTENLK